MSGVVWFELSKSGKWREGPSEPPSGMVAGWSRVGPE